MIELHTLANFQSLTKLIALIIPRWRKLVVCAQFPIQNSPTSLPVLPVSPVPHFGKLSEFAKVFIPPLAQACSLCPIQNSPTSLTRLTSPTLWQTFRVCQSFSTPQFKNHNSKFKIPPLSINILSITCSVILQSSKKLWGRGNKFGKNLQSNRLVATIRLQLTY